MMLTTNLHPGNQKISNNRVSQDPDLFQMFARNTSPQVESRHHPPLPALSSRVWEISLSEDPSPGHMPNVQSRVRQHH